MSASTGDRVCRGLVHRLLERLEHGQLLVVEAGRRRTFGSGSPRGVLQVNSPRFWRALLKGSRGLGDAYAHGLWDSPDLAAVVRVAAVNMPALDRQRRRVAPLRGALAPLTGLLRRNTRQRSRRDIAAHYDLGNQLFGLMLDPTMMYSSAIFERPGMTLEQASVAKLERICTKLDIGPEDHVLEIGTGWGGFALHAAGTRGCRVTTTTISREQHDLAVQRVREAGLDHLITVRLDDYRDLRGRYDKLVSIEVIEAVGWRDFGTFFERCANLLAPDGAMMLQAITIAAGAYEVEKDARSFANTAVFPGGCLPSLEVLQRCVARRTDLRPVSLEDISPHYVQTLRHWRRNFERHQEQAQALGYDERFRRLWRLYLAYSEGGFAERRIQVVQLMLAKAQFRAERVPALSALVGLPHDPQVMGAVNYGDVGSQALA